VGSNPTLSAIPLATAKFIVFQFLSACANIVPSLPAQTQFYFRLDAY
jgi:hypothetical protein